MNAAILIGVMAAVTAALRFLPFLIFRDEVPAYISYLGKVLPPAGIGLLVVYCLKDTNVSSSPHGIPEALSLLAVVLMQVYKRNAVISILAGTALYMLLIRLF